MTDPKQAKADNDCVCRKICSCANELQSDLEKARAECDSLRASLAAMEGENKLLRELILWALGEGGRFPDRPDDWDTRKYKPWFWWRTELRKRLDDIQPGETHGK